MLKSSRFGRFNKERMPEKGKVISWKRVNKRSGRVGRQRGEIKGGSKVSPLRRERSGETNFNLARLRSIWNISSV
jgi:hypothetical protein